MLSIEWTAEIYSAILNARLLRLRIDFRHVRTRATAAPRVQHCRRKSPALMIRVG